MPASMPSTFASAAAGGNLENGVNRRDGSSGNEWSRNRPNGATQTFRRTSQTSSQSRDNSQPAPTSTSSGPYIPPHLNQAGAVRNGPIADSRYSKDQLLGIYKGMKDGGSLNHNLDSLFQGPWDHAARNGSLQSRDNKDQPGPEVCWNSVNDGDPFGLIDMSDAERQLFTTSVNSPIKMTQNKEGGTGTSGARKPSISSHHNAAYGVSTGSAGRPGVRRRETSDSFTANGPLSPVESKTFFRNEPNTNTPPALLRRRTDFQEEEIKVENKENDSRVEGEPDTQTPFASLRRLATGPLSAGLNGPASSPWSAAPGGPRSAFESMGGFGNFAVGSPAGPESEKRPGFGSARGGSRFKDLLAKTSVEDMSPSVKEKASFGALGKLPEEDADSAQSRLKDVFKTRPNRSETNPYDEGVPRTGSAALSHDDQGIEQMGFSSFGPNAGQPDIHGTPHGRRINDPTSPSNTNPYGSPPGGRAEDDEGLDQGAQSGGQQPFAGGRRDVFSGAHDQSQPSGFGAPRPGLGGIGSIPGWGPSTFGSGTPGRERTAVSTAFGDSIFSPITDLQSPGGTALGGGFFGGLGPIGSAGRPNRLGALFPPAMQEQMRSDSRNDAFEGQSESRDPFDGSRRQEGFRNLFDEGRSREGGNFSPQPGAGSQTSVGAPGTAQRNSAGPEQPVSGHGLSQSSGSSGSNVLPAAQQRQMVMPDRMRWIYRDPQGNVQGPWSGLEMHDWFKAGFFTAELQVKKLEDTEYEPLAQLVRRIGNSREPFLVPQIGVPHGPPAANTGNHWASNMGTTAGGAQPPFANSFPSFGTTLTAEQQNALERRKQEEQYLMARQKEHLAQQQMYMKQMQMHSAGGMHGLQHHASTHSLHSQPSFGSITSPAGYQSSPMQAPIQPPQSMHGFGPAPGSGVNPQGRDEELPNMMDRMSFNQRAGGPFGPSPIGTQPPNIGQSFQERSRLGPEGQQAETRAHEEAFLGQDGRNERLEEFQDLRDEFDHEDAQIGETSMPLPIGAQRPSEEPTISKLPPSTSRQEQGIEPGLSEDDISLSLTQQVQRTAAAYEKAAAEEKAVQPPPVSISPLPAPAAQRNRQHVADALAAGSRSPTQTPALETPTSTSVAPWADKSVDMPKGPSLKEIQEAEAKRAAEQEASLAIARRAQAEQERLAAAAVPPPAPGLPSTSTWASSNSPVSPGPTSVWAKQGTKPAATSGTAKKTLAQIQKEEEARKQRAAAQAAAQAQAAAYSQQATVAGKRYAELASKVVPTTTSPATGGAWTTVGSGGAKAKTPATVVAAPTTPRTVSTGNVVTSTVAVKRPALQTSTSRTGSMSSQSKANEEFSKWVKLQLSNGLNSGINVDNFVQNLLMLPPEIEIIRDSVYASSQTIHGGRFAEEFVRRRKLADKGIVEPVSDSGSPGPASDSKSGSGGWSEVAKKGPAKEVKEESSNAAFKVVSKKKGRK